MPLYVTASFVAFINFYVALKIHRVYSYTTAITRNQRIWNV